jgi:uncharacterized protein YbjT (DUF2867 family)
MDIAIVGGGLSGEAIGRALISRGATVTLLSRSTGFDVLRDDAKRALKNADVVVEATGRFTMSRKVATDFFTRSTRAIGAATGAAGAKHILLSIVNCEKPEMRGYGYFAGKAEQERVAREENPDVVIVRSTQWFEFAVQNLERLKLGPFALVPAMTIKPVALAAVAEVIADCALGNRTGISYDVTGPEAMTLWDMTKRIRREGQPIPLPLVIPGSTGRAFRNGGMVPGVEAEEVGPSFADWLAATGA